MRTGFAEHADGKAPDIGAIIHRLERGRLLDRLPRRQRRRWGDRVQIIVDRSQRLIPFFEDQNRMAVRLATLFPRHAVEFAFALDGFRELFISGRQGSTAAYELPDPGTLVIMLGDLGCLASDPGSVVARWAALGQRLVRAGCRPAALAPCPPSRWLPARLRAWTMVAWDRRASSLPVTQKELDARTERLLRLLSPAIRIEPGLLRDIRLLLGAAADAGTEADVWQHSDLKGRSSVAATLDPEVANRLRSEFARTEPPDVRARVVEHLRRWRGGDLAAEVWFEELLSLDRQTRDLLPVQIRTGDLAAAGRRLADLAPGLASRRGGPAWYRRVYERISRDYHEQDDLRLKVAQQQLYLTAHQGVPNPPPPPANFDPRLVEPSTEHERVVELRQIGAGLVAAAVGSTGSLVGTLRTANGLITVFPEVATEKGDRDRNTFWAAGAPPAWADDWGEDAHGAWASFSVVGKDGARITQRLRWCPPGLFQMGSPETEEGRWDDEGPRHEVAIGEGFWMFDTACTEALWEAVTGKAPDPRRGEAFPVTNVSWEDAQSFLRQVNAAKPGLDLSLPSEAQWEYACRAGTDTPYNFGTAISRDQVCYESGAPVPVGSLPPNGWGLFEMHGNGYEWCTDLWHRSYDGAPADGSAWIGAGAGGAADRVLRGGSWFVGARDVRAAYRYGSDPAVRDDGIGFRCARVQAANQAGGAAQVAAPADPARRPGAERGRPQGPTSDATLHRVGVSAPMPLPRAGGLLIRTDREELRLGRLTKPGWASEIGRDGFGLFADVALPNADVIQRMRWIPPGRFLMGSPDGEEGRFEWEGPRHDVTLAEGFWLFDTPCTQALWQSLMGENPSRFKSPTRPVEQVSFEDVRGFLDKLNGLVPDLGLTLPSEAQWEYACRAGTETATYAGDMRIVGENNAPVLDAIAWYGGNSGVGFDLDNGHDTSDWKEKQYDHTRAGTRSVAQKAANPWGLYDMLGNVYEWCGDHWHDSYRGAPTDGSAWIDPGSAANRVLRGGSWLDDARGVRAAYRSDGGPADRDGDIGFRCARVQSDSVVSETERRAGRSKRRERSDHAATTSPKRGGPSDRPRGK
jgi:formylglycine-generating enzyme required for sulfatase activity